MTPWLVPSKQQSLHEIYFLNRRDRPLTDCIKCEVTEERNGAFFLEMEYPYNGQHAEDLAIEMIIMAKPYEGAAELEPFRITTINSSLNGHIQIYAEHISYWLNSVLVKQATGTGASPAYMWNVINGQTIGGSEGHPFSFDTDFVLDHYVTFNNQKLTPLKMMLGGEEGSMLDLFGGEFKWNRFMVYLLQSRGQDNGVTIAYGKNIIGLDYEIDLTEYWNAVAAYYNNDNLDFVCSDLKSENDGLSYVRAIGIDASSEYQTAPSKYALNVDADNYLTANYRPPRVTVNVDFIPLWQTKEYEAYRDLEFVQLCDTVHVECPPLGVTVSAKVVKTVYDALSERYKAITIGTPSKNLADTIVGIIEEMKK